MASKKTDTKKPKMTEKQVNPLVALSDDANLPTASNPALHRYLQEISQY